MSRLDELIKKLCPNGVEFVPLWSVTIWDKKFNSVDKKKQPKVISYPYLLAKDMFALEQEDGDVFLLSTGERTGWTTEDIAGDFLCEGEVVSIPWGKSRKVSEVMKYYTVSELIDRYVNLKRDWRENTRRAYGTAINRIKEDTFGQMKVRLVKPSDAKAFYIDLHDKGSKRNTITIFHSVLRPAFEMAVDDDIIRKNPFKFQVSDILQNDAEKRTALTDAQQKAYLMQMCLMDSSRGLDYPENENRALHSSETLCFLYEYHRTCVLRSFMRHCSEIRMK